MLIRLLRARRVSPIGALLFVVALASLASGACSTGPKLPPAGLMEADQWLFERGTEALAERKWFAAREYFRRLVDGFPQSSHREDAKLGVGDTYIGENSIESNILAINEFREFLTFYPTHRRADYAQYKLGMAHFKQMRAPERDQSETRSAIREFESFVTRYPNSTLMPEVKTHLRESHDRLSESEFLVGRFYYRINWYQGAEQRLKEVLKQDPAFTGRDDVYFYLGESLVKLGRQAEALPYFEKLIDEFEESVHLEEARKRAELLKTQLQANKSQ